MNVAPLGRLEKVSVRDVWQTEAQHFTPWLARPDNLAVLAEALNMELEIEAQEKNVGPFRADILCKDAADGSWVLIENQLERTDHGHLGQLLTYASGLQTVTIVWIATEFTEEHRAALDWLNVITDEKFKFFGLEVELWRIGDSPAAPKFNMVSQPNEWSRSVGQAARRIEAEALTETKALQLRFWTQLQERLRNHPSLRPQKPLPQNWYVFRIGRSGFHLGSSINTREERIGVELYIHHDSAKAFFGLLKKDKERIDAEIGLELEWQELPNRAACRIAHYRNEIDPFDEARWPEYLDWMIHTLERFHAVFVARVRALDADQFDPEAPGL
ncbi:DUF4268 domain-containing protein [Mesorhizobium sp. MSK_1335]|uniref:DUF4268 domain-containing protein n=1 Tax=Mesorhizobium montanum TaxID=3072323 RepID=A0ABU4ZKF9_9HYPH|nr:DUF4268 domain-containing protein [Mesorhizobium sp. MSK_1335]MDX8525132.1 DUF4268 domain-containing protein [Mesorhizobium sp. MSK_1335]